MAKYTTQLRTVIQNQSDEFTLFDFAFPMYSETYRPILIQKIINRFYFREIGFETVAMFKHYLKTKLNEIMPYYNKLYLSDLMAIDPLVTHRINESNTRTTTGNATASSSSNSFGNEVFSDTPQGSLTVPEGYATNVTDNLGESSGQSEQQVTNLDEFIKTITGNTSNKSDAELIMLYRSSLINVDEKLLNELNELFMQIY